MSAARNIDFSESDFSRFINSKIARIFVAFMPPIPLIDNNFFNEIFSVSYFSIFASLLDICTTSFCGAPD